MLQYMTITENNRAPQISLSFSSCTLQKSCPYLTSDVWLDGYDELTQRTIIPLAAIGERRAGCMMSKQQESLHARFATTSSLRERTDYWGSQGRKREREREKSGCGDNAGSGCAVFLLPNSHCTALLSVSLCSVQLKTVSRGVGEPPDRGERKQHNGRRRNKRSQFCEKNSAARPKFANTFCS